jgi:hypothetical protein
MEKMGTEGQTQSLPTTNPHRLPLCPPSPPPPGGWERSRSVQFTRNDAKILYMRFRKDVFLRATSVITLLHRLNMELCTVDLQSLFGLHVYSSLAENPKTSPHPPPPVPSAFGLIHESTIGQPR